MYFIIFQPKNILKLCLNFNEFQPYMLINVRLMKKKEFTLSIVCHLLGIIHLALTLQH